MRKINYTTVEELLTDDSFLAWHHQTNEIAVHKWVKWIEASPAHKRLADEAVQLLSMIGWAEEESLIPEQQVKASYERLIKTIVALRMGEHELSKYFMN